jgi:LysM repeat protein
MASENETFVNQFLKQQSGLGSEYKQLIDAPLDIISRFGQDRSKDESLAPSDQVIGAFQQAKTAFETFGDFGGRAKEFQNTVNTFRDLFPDQFGDVGDVQVGNIADLIGGSGTSDDPRRVNISSDVLDIFKNIDTARDARLASIQSAPRPETATKGGEAPSATMELEGKPGIDPVEKQLQGLEQPRLNDIRDAGGTFQDYKDAIVIWRGRDDKKTVAGEETLAAEPSVSVTDEFATNVQREIDRLSTLPEAETRTNTINRFESLLTGETATQADINRFGSQFPGEAVAQTQALVEPEVAVPQSYQIQPGDNLTQIANTFGTSIAEIMALNPQITNPNLIFSGQSLNIPGGLQAVPTEEPAPDFNPLDTINDIAQQTSNMIDEAKSQADSSINAETRQSEFEAALAEIMADTSDIDLNDTSSLVSSDGQNVALSDSSLVQQYQALIDTPRIQGYQDELLSVQTELAEIEAAELAMVNDLRAEVEGEASESYIQALASKRMQDIYPRKLSLQRQQAALEGALSGEKENAANIMQYYAQDEQRQYDRMWDKVNFLSDQFASEQDMAQAAFDNDISILNAIKTLPDDRSVTIAGNTYQGIASTEDLKVVQVTRPNGDVVVMGIDSNTGTVKYEENLGPSRVSSGSGGKAPSAASILKELKAELELDYLSSSTGQGIMSGKYIEVEDPDTGIGIVINKNLYQNDVSEYGSDSVNLNDYNINNILQGEKREHF